jgi:hypothetical protein
MLKPGECDADGNIQSDNPVASYASGIVIIKRDQLPAAMQHGWEEWSVPSIPAARWTEVAEQVYLDPGADLVAVRR